MYDVLLTIDWIDKAVLLPLVKAVFAYSLKEQEIKAFLSSSTLRAMVSGSYCEWEEPL